MRPYYDTHYMARNLRARLRIIRETKKDAAGTERASGGTRNTGSGAPQGFGPEWSAAGFKTLKRTVTPDVFPAFPAAFPRSLAVLAPDLFKYTAAAGDMPCREAILFFDLETTGLSGGAGTVAFLAAFGRLKSGVPEITQYLLLDYSGEPDFVAAVVREFNGEGGGGRFPLVVSYNGKTFDSQILKNRCLMNGITPPEYFHADLLHPARRLWKQTLPDCSQATIETQVLGLDRSGDIPGALAPDIWFSFLKTGETGDLLGICHHNLKDILGLAAILAALSEISAAPIETLARFRFDPEALALRWREVLAKRPGVFDGEGEPAGALLREAAAQGFPRALRLLAIEAEWRLRDFPLALAHTEKALELERIQPGLREDMLRRRERLIRKLS
jgi:uncharacterized protein YprB with RNaseH-like and TPR domain